MGSQQHPWPDPGDSVLFTFQHPVNGAIVERPALVVTGVKGTLDLWVFLAGRDDAAVITPPERVGALPRPCVWRSEVEPSETGAPEPGRWRRRTRRS